MAINLKKDNLVRNLLNRYKLVPLLDQYIARHGEFEWSTSFKPKEGDDAFHPSGDCLPSVYELFHMAKGTLEGKPHSVSLRKSFGVGHYWHAYLQEIVTRGGWADLNSIERRGVRRWGDGPYHWATGAGDIAPCSIPGHGDYLIDIKTMNGMDFKQPKLPNWCANKYIAQVNIYMSFFDIDKAIILCVQKDSPHEFKEHLLHRNQDLIEAIFSKWELVSYALDRDEEPPEEPFDLPFGEK